MKGRIDMQLRRILGIMVLCMMMLLAFGCGNSQKADQQGSSTSVKSTDTVQDNKTGKKSLVVYFSYSGNTEYVAQVIAKEAGADTFKIEPADTRYEVDNDTLSKMAREEQQQGARPPLAGKVENLSQYDTVYIGCPNWAEDMPMIVYTFLDSYDLSGKKIAPFVTHEGSGLSRIPKSIQSEEPDAKVVDGLAILGPEVRSSDSAIKSWVEQVQAAR